MKNFTNLICLIWATGIAFCAEKAKDAGELFVFVGEKITVEEIKAHPGSFDYVFQARYRVLQEHIGKLGAETIEFVAYDHYGSPGFSKYQHVLLYVVKLDGKFYHEKYLFDPLYKTVEGLWAGPYSTQDFRHPSNLNTTVRPVKMKFVEDVSYSVEGMPDSEIQRYFPTPYYEVIQGRAVARYGLFIEGLFQLQKDGVLKARGRF
ncbi:MAG: hypothetical protein H7X89_13240 [Rhizobiales bacterium]|nr:hypothetical protein [Hyphomicrobiales bacterium]